MTDDSTQRTRPTSRVVDGTDHSMNESAAGDKLLDELPRETGSLPDGSTFALCLSHDVDRPYKGLRSLYYATREQPRYHLRTALESANPYWQFEEIMAFESELDVRSSFYFLNEQHLLTERPASEWLSAANWVQHLGRYDITASEIVDVMHELDTGGWEVGLHGSYHSSKDPNRLQEEKELLESVLGQPVSGGRQHHMKLTVPNTWEYHRAIGLDYDTSLGSSTGCGFHAGYYPIRPFGDEFLVFPLTIMEQALPDPGRRFEAARDRCEELLLEAAENDAVMSILWHPRYFNEREFPGYRKLYRWVVERALELGAWVGSPGELYAEFERDQHEESTDQLEESPDQLEEWPDQLEDSRVKVEHNSQIQ